MVWAEKRGKEMQMEERWGKIRESRYNKWYQWINGEGIPEYLKKGKRERRCRRIARFRLGNEVKERKY